MKVFFKAQTYFGVGCTCGPPPGDQHDVKGLGPTVMVVPKVFAAQSFDSVPLNGRAHFFGNNQPQTRASLPSFHIQEDEKSTVAALADFGDFKKFRPLEDSVLLFERNRNHTGISREAIGAGPCGPQGCSGRLGMMIPADPQPVP